MTGRPLPPMDWHTVETLEHIDQLRREACICGRDAGPPFARGRLEFLTLDEYAALLESRAITASGAVRCSGWAQSAGRQCGHHSPHDAQTGVWHWSECCVPDHRGVWINTAAIGRWQCEHHGGPGWSQT